MLTQYETMFDKEQLQKIDDNIEHQMSAYLEGLMEQKICSLLRSEMNQYVGGQWQIKENVSNYELNIIQLFNQLDQRGREQQKKDYLIIEQINRQICELRSSINDKNMLLNQNNLIIQELKCMILAQSKEKNQCQNQIYRLKQEITQRDQKQQQQINSIYQIMAMKDKQITKFMNQIDVKEDNNEILTVYCQQLQKQRDALLVSFRQMQQQLMINYERSSLNLTTATIFASDLTEKYQEVNKYFIQAMSIYKQNRQIIGIINKIDLKFNYQLPEIGQYQQPNTFSFKKLQLIQYQSLKIKQILANYSIKTQKQIAGVKIKDQTICHLKQQLNKIKQIYSEQTQEINSINRDKSILEKEFNNWRRTNQSVIIQIQHNKQQVQKQVIQLKQTIKEKDQQIKSKTEEISIIYEKLNKLQQILEGQKLQTQALVQQLRALKRKNNQIEEQLKNAHSNLKIVIKTQTDEEDSISLVEQLVEKNSNIVHQLSNKKQAYNQILEEKNNLFEEICQLRRENNIQKQQLQVFCCLEKELRSKNKEIEQVLINKNQIISEQQRSLANKDDIINALGSNLQNQQSNQIQLLDAQVQTDQTPLIESKIKRQNIMNKTIKLQTEKSHSHSLLTDREDNKQNTNRQNQQKDSVNEHKLKIRVKLPETAKSICNNICEHKQKIVMLNQIINYMVNYTKGYSKQEIRQHSWLYYQICKHGTQYQNKICDDRNMLGKMSNIGYIDELCKKQQGCRLLVRDFQNIMDYYFSSCSQKQQSQMNVVVGDKFNKTINKFKRRQGSIINY